jgi:hypothetical protein
MDAIRRAKIDSLIPILVSAHETVRDLMDQEQDAFETTPANLKEARHSGDLVHYLNEAEGAIDHAIECMKYASGVDQPPELPATSAIPMKRRI